MEAQTMREFDALCLPPVKKYTAAQSADALFEDLD
jgi:hypothetical protein